MSLQNREPQSSLNNHNTLFDMPTDHLVSLLSAGSFFL